MGRSLPVAERSAQRRDVRAQARFLHDRVWPDLSFELAARDDLTGSLEQRQQEIEGTAPELDGRIAAENGPLVSEQSVGSECEVTVERFDVLRHASLVVCFPREVYAGKTVLDAERRSVP
jgi:hypothetical protein